MCAHDALSAELTSRLARRLAPRNRIRSRDKRYVVPFVRVWNSRSAFGAASIKNKVAARSKGSVFLRQMGRARSWERNPFCTAERCRFDGKAGLGAYCTFSPRTSTDAWFDVRPEPVNAAVLYGRTHASRTYRRRTGIAAKTSTLPHLAPNVRLELPGKCTPNQAHPRGIFRSASGSFLLASCAIERPSGSPDARPPLFIPYVWLARGSRSRARTQPEGKNSAHSDTVIQ